MSDIPWSAYLAAVIAEAEADLVEAHTGTVYNAAYGQSTPATVELMAAVLAARAGLPREGRSLADWEARLAADPAALALTAAADAHQRALLRRTAARLALRTATRALHRALEPALGIWAPDEAES